MIEYLNKCEKKEEVLIPCNGAVGVCFARRMRSHCSCIGQTFHVVFNRFIKKKERKKEKGACVTSVHGVVLDVYNRCVKPPV